MGALTDFFLGSDASLSEGQEDVLSGLQGTQTDIQKFLKQLMGRVGDVRERADLDPATARLIRAQTGAVQASTGASLAGRLANAGTLGGGLGTQALQGLAGDRQRALASGLGQASIAGRQQNQQLELALLNQFGQGQNTLLANQRAQAGIESNPAIQGGGGFLAPALGLALSAALPGAGSFLGAGLSAGIGSLFNNQSLGGLGGNTGGGGNMSLPAFLNPFSSNFIPPTPDSR